MKKAESVGVELTKEELSHLMRLREPNAKPKRIKQVLSHSRSRIFGHLGTTVTGLYLHYDTVADGFITHDPKMLGKGIITMLAFMYSKDPVSTQTIKEAVSTPQNSMLLLLILTSLAL